MLAKPVMHDGRFESSQTQDQYLSAYVSRPMLCEKILIGTEESRTWAA